MQIQNFRNDDFNPLNSVQCLQTFHLNLEMFKCDSRVNVSKMVNDNPYFSFPTRIEVSLETGIPVFLRLLISSVYYLCRGLIIFP